MTVLSFRVDPLTFKEKTTKISDVVDLVPAAFRASGFTDVKQETGHTFGIKSGVSVDVLYLTNGDAGFWQIVFSSGDVEATNDLIMGEIRSTMKEFTFGW